jgi:hypothetical protein
MMVKRPSNRVASTPIIEVLARVAATNGLVTPIGRIAFDPSGDLRQPVISLYRIHGGRIEFVRQVGG